MPPIKTAIGTSMSDGILGSFRFASKISTLVRFHQSYIPIFGVPRIFGNEKDRVAWFDGYTRVTRRFLGHLYFRDTYRRAPTPPGLSIYPRGPHTCFRLSRYFFNTEYATREMRRRLLTDTVARQTLTVSSKRVSAQRKRTDLGTWVEPLAGAQQPNLITLSSKLLRLL